MRRDKLVDAVIIILLLAFSIYVFASQAEWFYTEEINRGGKGYVSDEVWYVGTARVILVRVFGLWPKPAYEWYGATLVFNDSARPNYALLSQLASKHNVTIVYYYTKLNGAYVNGSYSNVVAFLRDLENAKDPWITGFIPGWPLPDQKNMFNYFNLEHPPLGKYVIAATISFAGDSPVLWRIPIVAAGAITIVLLYLILVELTRSRTVGLLIGVSATIDPLAKTLFSIELLDGYVALTTVLAMYLIAKRRYHLAFLAGLIGGLFKMSGLFVLIPVSIVILRQRLKSDKRFQFFAYSASSIILSAIILYVVALTVSSLPLIFYRGVSTWIDEGLIGPLGWHLSVKCTVNCPPVSAPWDWFLGTNSFILFYTSKGVGVEATGLYPVWLAALVLTFLLLPSACRKSRLLALSSLFLLGVFSGYLLVWVLGGRTQYSFYSIQLEPLVYISLGTQVFAAVSKPELYLYSLSAWARILKPVKWILDRLLGILRETWVRIVDLLTGSLEA